MQCRHCGEEITGRPVRQGSDFFCSLECANLASGISSDEEEEGYYEEHEIEGLYDDEE
ncbi:MAG: hypothetical protein OEW00_05985 [candidate division Zixibacteria bacterium]|nr:hypothetical protein [candidate division Zixibacteria bacterium]